MNGSWRQVTPRHPQIKVSVPLGAWTAELTVPPSDYGSSQYELGTRFWVNIPNPCGFGFLLTRRRSGPSTQTVFRSLRSFSCFPSALLGVSSAGANEVLLANEQFESEFELSSDEADVTRRLFEDPEVQTRLRHVGQPLEVTIQLERTGLASVKPCALICDGVGLVTDLEYLKAIHALLLALAERVAGMPLPKPAENRGDQSL